MGIFKLFFGFIWRTITFIRNSIANLLFLIMIVVLIVALAPKEPNVMPDNIALTLNPSGVLVDQYTYIAPINRVLGSKQDAPPETRVDELTTAIERAAKDPRITALVLDLGNLTSASLSKLEEVGTALTEFRASRKSIYAIGNHYTQEQYYLASFADKIVMNPMGGVILSGYGSYRNYFKDAFSKLALNFHVFRTGEYKDAIEPFISDHMSDASKENNGRWLSELWKSYTRTVEDQRQLNKGSINQYINNIDTLLTKHRGDGAQLALDLGLVDQLGNGTEQILFLRDKLGADDSDGYRSLTTQEYLHHTDNEQIQHSDRVGVLIASGTILDGDHPAGTIGSETLTQLIRAVKADKSIKALVVRIDSGGGSAFASETIRQELNYLRGRGVPVVVSMGSVAASGGYWIAMAADEVWATPTTITGSIGVFSAFPTLENSLDKLGIHTDGVGTTKLAGSLRLDRPLSSQVESLMQQSVDHIYGQFLTLVAEARETTPEAIHKIAQGRVWSGTTAKKLGLVDSVGGLNEAIAAAAKLANLNQYSTQEVRRPPTPGEIIAEQLAKDLQLENQSLGALSTGQSSAMTSILSWLTGSPSSEGLLSYAKNLERSVRPALLLKPTMDPRSVYAQCVDCTAP